MADETNNEEQPEAKSKLPKKMIIIVGAVMLVEALAIGGLWMLFGSQPETLEASEQQQDELAEQEELVEVLLIADKFQNTRQGTQAYLYDATVYVLVKRKNQGRVETQIEESMHRIKQDIVQIFAKAEPAHLNEPERQTLKRHILAVCEQHFGYDSAHEPYVEAVIISDWKRFSTDL
ncbi:MAG: hypothetical protein AAGC44_05965 [Planctomycetota bacterium]